MRAAIRIGVQAGVVDPGRADDAFCDQCREKIRDIGSEKCHRHQQPLQNDNKSVTGEVNLLNQEIVGKPKTEQDCTRHQQAPEYTHNV
jgi:hypothetical protein